MSAILAEPRTALHGISVWPKYTSILRDKHLGLAFENEPEVWRNR